VSSRDSVGATSFRGRCLPWRSVLTFVSSSDNLCDPEISNSTGHANQTFSGVELLSGDFINVTVVKDESVVFCNQNWREYDSGIFFPPTSRIQPAESRWMNGSQEDLTDVYGFTALAVLVGFILVSYRRLSLLHHRISFEKD
jgi:hypothetical protein